MKVSTGVAIIAAIIVCQLWSNLFSQTGFVTNPTSVTPVPSAAGVSSIQVVSTTLPNGLQQIVLVETNSRVMSVYQIPPQDGKIQLKSVRNLNSDFALEEFNAMTPLPSELRQIR